MTTFKAYRIYQNGDEVRAGFETLSLDDLSPGNVLIRARYSGINYKDALAATGAGRILKSSPLIGGIDVAGTVESCADDSFHVGQKVVVTGCGLGEEVNGGYSEFVRVPAESVVALPASLSCWDAMCLGTAGFTAALAITRLEHNGLAPDKGEVIVTGATGGVGSLAVSMLSGLGYRVVALTGKPNAIDYLSSIGATRVLLRDELTMGTRPLEKALWSGAIDNVGSETLAWLTRTTDWWGSIASIGLAGGYTLNTTVMPFILRGVNLLGINSVRTPRAVRLKIWQRLATDLRSGHLSVIGQRTAKFDQLPTLFQEFVDGGVTGRTIIAIDPETDSFS